jgi:hypothetical protein
MKKKLRDSIENVLFKYPLGFSKEIDCMRKVYFEERTSKTITALRVEFLEECLESGMSKREAARQLVKKDHRIGQRSAETLVYVNFSGDYQTSTRRTKLESNPTDSVVESNIILDISSDEDLL